MAHHQQHTLVCHNEIEDSVIVANICPDRETHKPLIASSSHFDVACSAGALGFGVWLLLVGVAGSAEASCDSVKLCCCDGWSHASSTFASWDILAMLGPLTA